MSIPSRYPDIRVTQDAHQRKRIRTSISDTRSVLYEVQQLRSGPQNALSAKAVKSLLLPLPTTLAPAGYHVRASEII
jgi:hypothetical protein